MFIIPYKRQNHQAKTYFAIVAQDQDKGRIGIGNLAAALSSRRGMFMMAESTDALLRMLQEYYASQIQSGNPDIEHTTAHIIPLEYSLAVLMRPESNPEKIYQEINAFLPELKAHKQDLIRFASQAPVAPMYADVVRGGSSPKEEEKDAPLIAEKAPSPAPAIKPS